MRLNKALKACLDFAVIEFNPETEYVISDGRRQKDKANDAKIYFARFCQREGLKPEDVAELIALAEFAALAGTDYHNINDSKMEPRFRKAQEAVETKAAAMGCECDWSGLYPTITHKGYQVHLPYPANS